MGVRITMASQGMVWSIDHNTQQYHNKRHLVVITNLRDIILNLNGTENYKMSFFCAIYPRIIAKCFDWLNLSQTEPYLHIG